MINKCKNYNYYHEDFKIIIHKVLFILNEYVVPTILKTLILLKPHITTSIDFHEDIFKYKYKMDDLELMYLDNVNLTNFAKKILNIASIIYKINDINYIIMGKGHNYNQYYYN